MKPLHFYQIKHTTAAMLALCLVRPAYALATDTPGPENEAVPSAGASAVPASVTESTTQHSDKGKQAGVAGKMTLDQIKASMAEAEQRRLEKLKPDPAIDNKQMAEQWGVEVIGISRTSGGYMLDFRFRVVDANKALPLFDHRIKPYVKAAKSDIKLPVPVGTKTGAMRPTNRGQNIKADKNYYMIFANPDSFVKKGEKVSVIIGDFRAENMTVNE
jgi:hypothetical protein